MTDQLASRRALDLDPGALDRIGVGNRHLGVFQRELRDLLTITFCLVQPLRKVGDDRSF